PYNVCAGYQDNGSWCGPSRRRGGELTNADWTTVGGGDGFYTAQDPTDPNTIYVESQGGNMSRLNFATGDRTNLQKPNWRPRYTQFEDSIVIERPDTTKPETAAQKKRIADLRVRQKADSNETDLRWNWNTPFLISAHNPETFYAGANKVMKSTRRGEDLYPISPDLTTKDSMRIRVSTRTTGGVTPDVTGAETYCTIVSLAESPIRPGLLYAGTDDGNVWITKNDGGTWDNITGRFPGVPAGTYVSRIEPSHFDTATFYITFDNHRSGDYAPYVFVTTDFGKSFRSPSPPYGADIVYRLATGSSDRRARTSIVIRDVRGDTVRTVQGPAGPGLHRVIWNFQGRTPPPVALSPSQKRDSAWLVQRIDVVFDSLAKNGGNAQQLDPIKALLVTGDVQGI